MVQIFERYQILNGMSPFDAGPRLLPFIIVIPASSIVSAAAIDKYKIKHAYALLSGVILQLLGAGLFLLLPNSERLDPAEYASQTLLAVG